MNEGVNSNSGAETIRQIIESAVEVTLGDLEAVQGLVDQARTNKGAPFDAGNVFSLANLKKIDRAQFESLRGALKEAGVRVGDLDKQIEACGEDEDADASDPTRVLMAIVKRGRLFHTPDGKAYARMPVDDHEETWAIRSKGFQKMLRHQFYESEQYLPRATCFDSALDLIEAQATFDGPEERAHLRVAEDDGRLYVDLCNPTWQAIEVDKTGWRIIDNPPVNFRRAANMGSLPIPKGGGSINLLRRFVNLVSDDHFVLLISAILSYFRNHGPYPIIAFTGEQGAAKSSTTRASRNQVDPNASPLRALPKELRDLAISANNAHVLAFDNISEISAAMSDALCRLSTGGGFSTRQLYTDDDETVFDGQRPVMLNGIEEMIDRPDLADRTIFIELARIPDEQRRPEAEMVEDFTKAWPEILGALLDGAVYGLNKLPDVRLPRFPRMADFAKWAVACESAFWPSGTFMAAYESNRAHAVIDVLEGDLVSRELRRMIERRTEWTGTAGQLLAELESQTDDSVIRKRQWPDSPRGLSGKLRRAAPLLRKIGIKIEFSREGHNRDRIIHMCVEKDVD